MGNVSGSQVFGNFTAFSLTGNTVILRTLGPEWVWRGEVPGALRKACSRGSPALNLHPASPLSSGAWHECSHEQYDRAALGSAASTVLGKSWLPAVL